VRAGVLPLVLILILSYLAYVCVKAMTLLLLHLIVNWQVFLPLTINSDKFLLHVFCRIAVFITCSSYPPLLLTAVYFHDFLELDVLDVVVHQHEAIVF